MPDGAADERNAARHGGRLRLAVRRIRLVGMARMELVRTVRGSDDVVRMLRIIHAILRHVGTMGRFFLTLFDRGCDCLALSGRPTAAAAF